jgi:hypothetical protein
VATTSFHADEAQVLVAGRIPVVAMLVSSGWRRSGSLTRRFEAWQDGTANSTAAALTISRNKG